MTEVEQKKQVKATESKQDNAGGEHAEGENEN